MPARRDQLTPPAGRALADIGRALAYTGGALFATTAAVATIIAVWPGLPGHARDALQLQPDAPVATDADTVLLHNARPVVGILIAACVASRLGRARVVLDVALTAIAAVNATLIGAALGAYGTRIVGRLAHLPLEYAALTIAGATYLAHRHTPPRATTIVAAATSAFASLAAGALLEASPP